MVARGPGAVGCAHCTRLGAEQACAACGHLVCPACGADWTTCELATIKTFELERWTHVLDVDWGGRYLVVERGMHRRVFDLRAEKWVIEGLAPASFPTWMMRSGEVLGGSHLWKRDDHYALHYFGFAAHDADGKLSTRFEDAPLVEAPGVLSSDDEVIVYRHNVTHVTYLPVATRKWRVFEPLPGKVIEGVGVHGDLLAVASWGELALFRMNGTKLELRTHHALDGEVKWCALAGSTLAVADATHVRAWRVREDGNAHEVVLEVERKREGRHGPARAFALSRDGVFVVAGNVVHDLARRASHKLVDGHADDILFAKFVMEDRWLVTYDDDRRLVMRAEYKG